MSATKNSRLAAVPPLTLLKNELLMRQCRLPNVVWKLKRVKPSATHSEYQIEVLNKDHVSRHRLPIGCSDQQRNGNGLFWVDCRCTAKHTSSSVAARQDLLSLCHPSPIYISLALRFFESFFAFCVYISKLVVNFNHVPSAGVHILLASLRSQLAA